MRGAGPPRRRPVRSRSSTEAAMIKKRGSKWVVLSEKTGRSFGSYDTKAEAMKRLRQVEFFKHAKPGGARRRRSA
jgi:hypothetical protein